MDSDLLLFLSSINLSYNLIETVLDNYNTLEDLKYDNALRLMKLDPKNFNKVYKEIKNFDVNEYKEILWKKDIKYCTYGDKIYPPQLLNISEAPYTLYYKGNLDDKFYNSISVVGSRKCSNYGAFACKKLVSEISKYKIPVVSGLALGIDKLSHETALANDNKTIAVLGCGINQIYPKSNYKLYQDMFNSPDATIISEYPMGIGAFPYNFPFRNRIISGLSLATIVIEAKEKSGTLITASYALEQSRDVFAVPGNINSVYSVGTNRLIKDGAYLVSDADDILAAIPEFQSKLNESYQMKLNVDELKSNFDLTNLESNIIKLLKIEPYSPDEISIKLKSDISEILMSLTKMELLGIVTDIGSKYSLK